MKKKILLLIEFLGILFKYEKIVVVGYRIEKEKEFGQYTTNYITDEVVDATNLLEVTIDRLNITASKKQQVKRQKNGEDILNQIQWQRQEIE